MIAEYNGNLSDYYSQITGIEKEDRLAKVAKVAAYMHGIGQEQIKILDADALASHPEIPPESFDVLVANPPFAVEGFLQTLSDADKKQYQLIQATGESSDTNTIQCFFLERIHHLMAPGGLVGVIVPSSILSNTDAVHTRTRELLLQFFDLMSIAELGSGTFGKTGTNTVVLFLRRKAQKPEASEHYYDRVADFFEGDDESKEYQDDYLIKAYCEHIEVSYEEYIKLFAPTSIAQIDELLQCDIFKDYKQAFSQSTEMKNLKKSNVFRRKTATEQSAELEQRFIAYLHAIEKDKLYYFILAHEQENRVLIVNAPSKKKEQDQFLGYKWSGAKGHEGIQYEGGETVNGIITPLFDPNDLDNNEKINAVIKRNFIGETIDPLPEYCHYAKLTDMLDFSRTDFNKTISLNPKKNTDIETQWPLVKLGEVAEVKNGGTPDTKNPDYWNDGDICWATLVDTKNKYLYDTERKITQEGLNNSSAVLLPINTVIFSSRATIGDISIAKITAATNQGYKNFICNSDVLYYEYLFYLLKFYAKEIETLALGMTYKEISSTNIKNYQIPLPTLEVQQQIADECEAVDQETEQAHQIITAAKQMIGEKVEMVINAGYEMKKIGDVYNTSSGGTPLTRKKEYYENGTIPWINSGEVSKKEINFADNFINELGLNSSNAKLFLDFVDEKLFPQGTVLLAMYGATAGKVALLNIEASTNQALCALLPTEEMVPKFLVLVLEVIYQDLLDMRTGIARDNLSQEKIRNIKIPVPPLDIQQRLAAEVKQLEAEIAQSQAVIDNSTERKNAILTSYL